uniref:Uncharacterized protein n=1 Tax=Kwoniella dejecticola CBS 10117 TaxID=1296121 RepID=A0A1A6AEC4_9TREE|nr:uncharacterized protein I303_00211 [Kwoniella dejecticola CBS 10117]OBR88394.1 hypothetical protein I303_00211 [Kwoniella dejecticola CBS 10117]
MWLIAAIGPVHGQNRFTFALQQGKEYAVGRDDASDIKFESRQVRPKEGTLVVGDWDALQPNKPPSLRWRVEPKKSGAYGVIRTLGVIDSSDHGSVEREDYEMAEVENSQGCFLEKESVHGIELSEGMWFNAEWKEFSIQHDKMRDESAEVKQLLTQYCIAWTQSFDISARPSIVLSAQFRSNIECNYAVCFGIRIVTPSYLHALIGRFKICWKKMADSQDSFTLPDQESEEYRPDFDTALPASRNDPQAWLPDPSRETLFKEWKVLGLRARTPPAEKRYLIAMGADYQDIDILTKPVTSAQDFADRISGWLSHVDQTESRQSSIVVWFSPVKPEYEKKGWDYVSMIVATCQRLGVYHAHGGVLWGSVNKGGVQDYLLAAAANLPQKVLPSSDRVPSSVASTQSTGPAESRPAQSSQPPVPPASSQMDSSARLDFVPSTFPDETEPRPPNPASSSKRPTGLPRRTRQATSPLLKDKSPEPDAAVPVKKPLRRRAGKAVDLIQIPDSPPRSLESLQDDNSQHSQPLFSQRSVVPDSLPVASQASAAPMTQRTQTQSMMPSQSLATARPSRLKRRAGGAQPSLIEEIADTSINLEQSIKDEETAANIRQLYEQTKTGTFAPSIAKRPRTTQRGSGDSESASLAQSTPRDSQMDVDEPVSGAGSGSRSKRAVSPNGAMPPPAQRRRTRSPSEQLEEVEKGAKAEYRSPMKSKSQAKTQTGVTTRDKDEAFLQAIKKSTKARAAIDELDKEFNQLRIPKPNGKSAVVKANEWNASIPDYAILNDFDEDMRGNFIQIVRKDLFRKDKAGEKEVPRVDDGRPNFKKFKKKNIVRREPMQLALAASSVQDAELGEPYWPTQIIKPSRGGRGGTKATQMEDEDEDMPLLPRTKKRQLGTQVTQDDPDPPSTTRSRRQNSVVPETQQSQSSTQMPIVTKSRRTRAQSVLSEAESVKSAATSTRATRLTKGASTTAGRGRSKKEAVVLEDSAEEAAEQEEQEQDGIDWGLNASNTHSTRGRSGKGSSSTQARMTNNTGTKTLEGVDQPPSAATRRRTVNTQSSASAGIKGTQAQASQRRRLLPADDDDEVAFKGAAKKRRLLR